MKQSRATVNIQQQNAIIQIIWFNLFLFALSTNYKLYLILHAKFNNSLYNTLLMIKFIDLFAGIGGIRKGLEIAAQERNISTHCVFTSEIKPSAISVLAQNHPNETIHGDITQIPTNKIPDFDMLLAGFPCQAFSAAGKRLGFMDTRGTLFFEVERILKAKKPSMFLLENVEGLISHDKIDKTHKIGRTLSTILEKLKELGYYVEWKCLNSKYFGLAQERKRVYIVGTLMEKPDLCHFEKKEILLKDILEQGQPTETSPFIEALLNRYSIDELYGKSIKDKRGGTTNIHSWDIDLKGKTTEEQKNLLNQLFKERRKKKWAIEIGIDWMDGMPLTLKQISTFNPSNQLKDMLEDLVQKGYLKKEYPKKLVHETLANGSTRSYRLQDTSLPLGYNIVAGKLSFEVSKILSPFEVAPTLVAMDMQKLFVVDNGGLRRLTLKEGLRLFGYPDDYHFDIPIKEGYDLLGNTVAVPVIKAVADRLLDIYQNNNLNS